MTNTTINIQNLPSEPTLKDLLDYHKREVKLEINCHHIGTIQSFNSANQTAVVSINYKRTQKEFVSGTKFKYVQVDYAPIIDCPVICLGGGDAALTFPIATGDECLVLFNDRDIDNWFAGSSTSANATPRTHAFTDAIALVGIRSLNHVLQNYDTNAMAFRMGDNTIKVYSDKIEATVGDNSILLDETKAVTTIGDNTQTLDSSKVLVSMGSSSLQYTSAGKLQITNATGEFVAALNQLFTDIQSATASGFPLIMPTFPADLLVFQSFKA